MRTVWTSAVKFSKTLEEAHVTEKFIRDTINKHLDRITDDRTADKLKMKTLYSELLYIENKLLTLDVKQKAMSDKRTLTNKVKDIIAKM